MAERGGRVHAVSEHVCRRVLTRQPNDRRTRVRRDVGGIRRLTRTDAGEWSGTRRTLDSIGRQRGSAMLAEHRTLGDGRSYPAFAGGAQAIQRTMPIATLRWT